MLFIHFTEWQIINPTAIDKLILAFITSLLFRVLVLSLRWTPSELLIEDDGFLLGYPNSIKAKLIFIEYNHQRYDIIPQNT